MNIRFYFSNTSLEQNGLRHVFLKDGHGVYNNSPSVLVAEASLEGSHFYTTDEEISHPSLKSSVTHMTVHRYEPAKLTAGHYAGEDWEADLNINGEQTWVQLRVKGNDAEKLKDVYRQLTTGELLPAFVLKDKLLTSEQVAAIIYGEGDREHWLHVVQSAQDIVLKTAKTIEDLQQQVAALERQKAALTQA